MSVAEEPVAAVGAIVPIPEEPVTVVKTIMAVAEVPIAVVETIMTIPEEPVTVVETIVPVAEEPVAAVEAIVSIPEEPVTVIETIMPVAEEPVAISRSSDWDMPSHDKLPFRPCRVLIGSVYRHSPNPEVICFPFFQQSGGNRLAS